MTNFEKVKEFHKNMGLPHPRCLHGWSFIEVVGFRNSLILEELAEYNKAAASGDVLEVADALADILYVVYGTAVEHGIDIDRVFAEVHKSNMTKTPRLTDDSGKLMKGENYKAPNLNFLLEK